MFQVHFSGDYFPVASILVVQSIVGAKIPRLNRNQFRDI